MRIALRAFAGLLLVLPTGFAAGQGSAPAQTELSPATAGAEVVAIIHGLAPNDLLNVRKDPTPGGAVLTRLTNGAMVKRLRCTMVKDYEWCEIEAFEQGGVRGWTPSRYLLAGAEDDQGGTAAAPAAGQVLETAASAEDLPEPGILPIPEDLAERIGGASDADLTPEARQRAASIEAAATALTLALLAPEPPSADESTPGSANAEAAPDNAGSETPGADSAPVTEAALQVPNNNAAGNADEIPCARHLGQPMTTCRASVERKGDGAADVTVFWPDGGTRVIFFRTGKPDGSNAEGELTYIREAQLNMIRIGAAERFEILDKLPFGN
ncbi:SH3 domain-containing protein [Pseudaminobacter sp. 19-2017]|uniref:SH3 domain-containing protein n=1 Tax=Pseudaminobacter soli (ex Zhang et al. 2022) TaxID=2831468 RepID=A0A942I3W2_9HYPH|nr:SH3 domain-containing protein [Pseudaminobacter soli]MBS3650973.1 SH3 domain-containing protein [Pseudaminobacter soli]